MQFSKQILWLLIYLLGFRTALSQKEHYNWYFGQQAGITFNTDGDDPIFLAGNKLVQYEGCATYSDYRGNLLLYTNGVYVYNGHNVRINGSGVYLKGHTSSTQSAVIVKKPNSSDIFYIFTADAGEYIDPPNEGINFSIVDMSKMGGEGEIVSLNIPLLAHASEKLTTTLHANGKDVWVLAKGINSNNLYAWLLTENGIVDTVVTSIGFAPSSKNESIGYMKVNAKGNRVALVYNEKPFFELLKFDNKTGVFSDDLRVPIDNYYSLYGVEFSPNGNYIYISNSGTTLNFYTLFQFDIRSYDVAKIASSMVVVNKENGTIGALQVGPNNKIYIAAVNKPYLMGIANPNSKCPQCSFSNNMVDLHDSLSLMGLPQAIPQYVFSKHIFACEFQSAQLDPEDYLEDTIRYDFNYYWTGPNGFVSNLPRPSFNPVMVSDTGIYTLHLWYVVHSDTIRINFENELVVDKKLIFSIKGANMLCTGDTITLSADTSNSLLRYMWSSGSRRQSIRVSKGGIYKLFITSRNGCVDSAEISVAEYPKPKSEIIGSKLLCFGNPIVLSSRYRSDSLRYLWSTGDTVPEITISNIGKYSLTVKNSYGCSATSDIIVGRSDGLQVGIGGDSVICGINPANVYARIVPYDSSLRYEYRWSNGATDSMVSINKAGKLVLTVTIEGNCVYSAELNISKTDIPLVSLNNRDTVVLCNSESIKLEVVAPNSEYQYYWNTGEKGSSISPKVSGRYVVYAMNSFGCVGSDSVYVVIKGIMLFNVEVSNFVTNCKTDSVGLSVYPKLSNCSYEWSNGMIGDSVVVDKSGKYYVFVKDEDDCIYSAMVEVQVGGGANVSIVGAKSACVGDTIMLKGVISSGGDLTYEWSNGDTTEMIRVTKSGSYWVIIRDEWGCSDSANVSITFSEVPDAELNVVGEVDLCEGDSIVIMAKVVNSLYNYLWSDGLKSPSRVIRQGGVYKLLVSNNNMCFDSSEVEVVYHQLKHLAIRSNVTPILCDSGEIELYVDYVSGYHYRWSDGSTDTSMVVYQAGVYYLVYENDIGCMDSISFVVKSGAAKDFNIVADKLEFCTGDSVVLGVDSQFNSYLWSNGATSRTIVVRKGGVYSVEVSDENNCRLVKSIEIEEHSSDLQLDWLGSNDFESCEYSYIDSLGIVNGSGDGYVIDDIIADANLEILNKDELLGVFRVNEIKYLRFRTNNSNLGDNHYRIRFVSDKPCQSIKELVLNYAMKAETKIILDTFELRSGESVCIPIYYSKVCPADYIINSGFEFTIEIPAEYFYPESVSIGEIVSRRYVDGYWQLVVKVDGFVERKGESLLLSICGMGLLGSDTKAEFRIKSFDWYDDNISVSNNSGVISSVACAINLRGIQYFRPTSINVSPNPAKEGIELTINTSSVGRHIIRVYSGTAELVDERVFDYNNDDPYIHKFAFNVSNWESGIYFVVVESPWGIVNSEKLLIAK